MGGKTALQIRADMRLDLKDSGALWSDAELDRCVERAIADLNRYLPLEKYYEVTLNFAVTGESITFPADTDADRIVDEADLPDTVVAGSTLTVAAQPDVPRNLTMTITDADSSITYLSLLVKGTDKDGYALQEAFHYAVGMGVITGEKYFKTVNEVEVDQITGNVTGDKLDLGIGAYTDVWVYLANHPIKDASESATDAASNALTRHTDYWIDYVNGRLKAIAGANIATGEACTFAYTKIQIGIDMSDVPDFIRPQRVEYPVGRVPQSFVPMDSHGKVVFITGMGEDESQPYLRDKENVRVYYDAEHIAPNNWGPGTLPEFLENTVLMAGEAYALLIYVLKHEHQAETDMGSMRTATTAANTAHTALDTALTNVKKYLDDNTNVDAVGILAKITTDAADLRTAIETALDQAAAYLGASGVETDLSNADTVKDSYIGTTDYVAGGTEPDILAYLTSGDALINTITEGGESEKTPEMYAVYAKTVHDALVAAFEKHRSFYVENARQRTNASLALVQETSQRIQNLNTYIGESTGYQTISSIFAREAEARLNKVAQHLQEASRYGESASGEMVLAERYRLEALERRNEVLSIWYDRKQYIGDFTMGSVRQIPKGE